MLLLIVFGPPLVAAILSLFGGISLIRAVWKFPKKACIGVAVVFPLFLLSLQQFGRLAYSYDVLQGVPFHKHSFYENAILTPEVIMSLVFGITTLACAAILIILSGICLTDRSVRNGMLPPACLPALLLYLSQRHAGAEVRRHEVADGYARAQESGARHASACTGESSYAAEGCQEYVRSLAQQSDADLSAAGRRWAEKHEINTKEACQGTGFDFDPRPAFAAGCRAAAAQKRHGEGNWWGQIHEVKDVNDCEAGAGTSGRAEFVEGCTEVVHSNLRGEGFGWAEVNFIHDPADCSGRLPGIRQNPDFIAGCEAYINRYVVGALASEGARMARTKKIQLTADCNTAIPKAPPEFKQGCQDEVRRFRQLDGEGWAGRTAYLDDKDDCAAPPPEMQALGPEAVADFLEACRDEMKRLRRMYGRTWASRESFSRPEDCRSYRPGMLHSADFVSGCEEAIQHRDPRRAAH